MHAPDRMTAAPRRIARLLPLERPVAAGRLVGHQLDEGGAVTARMVETTANMSVRP